jgi:hypothetical protein
VDRAGQTGHVIRLQENFAGVGLGDAEHGAAWRPAFAAGKRL